MPVTPAGRWPPGSPSQPTRLAIGPQRRLRSQSGPAMTRRFAETSPGRGPLRSDLGSSSARLVQFSPIARWNFGTHARLTETSGSPKAAPCSPNRAAAEPADRTSGDQEGHRVAPSSPRRREDRLCGPPLSSVPAAAESWRRRPRVRPRRGIPWPPVPQRAQQQMLSRRPGRRPGTVCSSVEASLPFSSSRASMIGRPLVVVACLAHLGWERRRLPKTAPKAPKMRCQGGPCRTTRCAGTPSIHQLALPARRGR